MPYWVITVSHHVITVHCCAISGLHCHYCVLTFHHYAILSHHCTVLSALPFYTITVYYSVISVMCYVITWPFSTNSVFSFVTKVPFLCHCLSIEPTLCPITLKLCPSCHHCGLVYLYVLLSQHHSQFSVTKAYSAITILY